MRTKKHSIPYLYWQSTVHYQYQKICGISSNDIRCIENFFLLYLVILMSLCLSERNRMWAKKTKNKKQQQQIMIAFEHLSSSVFTSIVRHTCLPTSITIPICLIYTLFQGIQLCWWHMNRNRKWTTKIFYYINSHRPDDYVSCSSIDMHFSFPICWRCIGTVTKSTHNTLTISVNYCPFLWCALIK